MGTSSLHSDNPVQSRKKRSFSLPSFRKSSGERTVETNAEEMARIRKAAAWQWYTREVGEVVAPTKAARPAVARAGNSPVEDKCGVDVGELMSQGTNKQEQQKVALPDQPLQRGASRFKTEATKRRPTASADGAAPSPLYDEFQLSGLRTHMASFVQRLQQKHERAQEESLQAAAYGDQKSPAGISTAAAIAIPAAPSTNAFYRPLIALHRFLRKVTSGSALMKNTKNSPTMIATASPAVQLEPFAPLADEENAQYHYHHYIHHHHHHYHYGDSPEEGAAITRRRRHSESSGVRPKSRGTWEEVEKSYEGEEEEESHIQAFLARRIRRYSDNFAGHKAVSDAERSMQQAGALQLQRRYNSERFMSTSPNKIPMVDGRLSKLGSIDEIDGVRMQNADIRSRRHSAEILTEGAFFNKKSGEGCTRATRGGKAACGTYKLGGDHAGSAAPPMTEVPRRRHSETLEASYRREMNDHMDMRSGDRTSSSGGRPEQFNIPAFASRETALPPIYPQ